MLPSIGPGRKVGDPVVTDLRAIKYVKNGKVFYKLRRLCSLRTKKFKK